MDGDGLGGLVGWAVEVTVHPRVQVIVADTIMTSVTAEE